MCLLAYVERRWRDIYTSPFAPRYPPIPMLMVPATSSDSPPKMTTRGRPSADSPAVTANGTVSPSENPIVKLEMRWARKLAEVGVGESSSVVDKEGD